MPADVLADLRDTCDILCDPIQHRHPRWTWDTNRHKKPLPDHVVILPGLLAQVAAIVYPGSAEEDGSARPVPASRPPLRLDAASAWMQIHLAVTRWTLSLRLELRDTIESSVRQLLGRIAAEDADTQQALLSEMRTWRRQCELVCGEREPDPELQVPCPHCGDRRLRVNLVDRTARCGSCRSRWAEAEDEHVGSIGVLGRHIAEHKRLSKEAANRARAEDRERKKPLHERATSG